MIDHLGQRFNLHVLERNLVNILLSRQNRFKVQILEVILALSRIMLSLIFPLDEAMAKLAWLFSLYADLEMTLSLLLF